MTAVPIAVAKARRRIRHAFEDAGAYSPESAIGFEPQRRLERRWLDRMLAAGGIVEARPGAYYMDQEKYAAEDTRFRNRALFMIGAVIAALAAFIAAMGISQL